MIHYSSSGIHFFTKICKLRGSVFPFGIAAAAPCSLFAGLCKYFANEGHLGEWWVNLIDHPHSILKDNAMWSGFTFLVGFLVVFRTSQAYSRFWSGCETTYRMRAVWFSACSALCAFTRSSKQDETAILEFKELLVRMFSILHALAHAEIEDSNIQAGQDVAALNYPVIDPMALDYDVLGVIRDSETKPELVFQWIQQYIVEQIHTGVLNIPPPILSRAFQDLAGGMMVMYEAIQISCNPFPFPYAQTCDCLLIMHWFMTPLVASSRGNNPIMVTLFSFIQVFIMWTLNLIAVELENPFGSDANDLDCLEARQDMNQSLSMLLCPIANHLPRIPSKEKSHPDDRASLAEAWLILDEVQAWHGASGPLGTKEDPGHLPAREEAHTRVTCRRSARNRKGRQALTLYHASKEEKKRNSHKASLLIEEDEMIRKMSTDMCEDRSSTVKPNDDIVKSNDKPLSVVVHREEPIQNNDEESLAAEPTRESGVMVQTLGALPDSITSSASSALIAELRTSRRPSRQEPPTANTAHESASERLSKALKSSQDSPSVDSPQLKLRASLESVKRISHKLEPMPTPRGVNTMPTPRNVTTPRSFSSGSSRQMPATDALEVSSVSQPILTKNPPQSMHPCTERPEPIGVYDAPPAAEPTPKKPLRTPRLE